MSYDITTKIINARSRADLRAQTETDDALRDAFMSRVKVKNMTQYEMDFVENWAGSPKSQKWWTPKRREFADELRRKYS